MEEDPPSYEQMKILNSIIERGDLECVVQFLEDKQINGRKYDLFCKVCGDFIRPMCPVAKAASLDQIHIMNLLLSLGFSPNRRGPKSEHYRYPVHHACVKGYLRIVIDLILTHGVDIHCKDAYNFRPAQLAVIHGHLDIVKFLIQSGVSVNDYKDDHNRWTMLHRAVKGRQLEICKYLMTEGADVNYLDQWQTSPLLAAANENDEEIAKCLLESGADPKTSNCHKLLPVESAVKNNNLRMLKMLVDHGADVEISDPSGNSLLHHAVFGEFMDIVQYLVLDLNVRQDRVNGQFQTTYFVSKRVQDSAFQTFFINAGYDFTLDNILYGAVLDEPRSLVSLCCFTIRSILGRDVLRQAKSLPLPEKMKEFVKLSHLRT